MTTLTIYDTAASDATTKTVGAPITEPTDVATALKDIGVRYERWDTKPLANDAAPEDILQVYAAEVSQLKAAGGYQTADVVRLPKGAPNAAEMRSKFLEEHTHSEDEVRFFVEGSGAFYLHANDLVYQLICREGDLISVPAGIKHWFDMGPDPEFTAVRLFTNPEGWVANFTGNDIAGRIPLYE